MMSNEKYYVYCLVDPFNDKVRYIGITKNIESRFKQHIKESKRGNKNHRCNWIRSVLDKGELPKVCIIEEVNFEEKFEREKYWISYYGRENLVNGTDGGEGVLGIEKSDKLKKYLSDIFSGQGNPFYGKHHSEETKEKISKRVVSEETKEKIRKWHVGKVLSEEHKLNISKSLRENPSFLGKRHSEEAKEKNRLSHLGKPSKLKGIRTGKPSHNRGEKIKGKSSYVGVSKKGSSFCARVHYEGNRIYLVGWINEESTAMGYDIGAIFYYGKDAKLNFPNIREEYINHLSNYKIETIKELRLAIKDFVNERS